MEKLIPLIAIAICLYGIFGSETKKEAYTIRSNGKPVDLAILGRRVNLFRLIVIAISVFVIITSTYTLL